MGNMRKITAFVPAQLLKTAQEYTGAGVSETLRLALQRLAHAQACRELLALKGKVHLDIDLNELREDREFDQHGDIL
jgi:hypothetical protein